MPKKKINILNNESNAAYDENREEYIKALEMSVSLLRSEVENLRGQLKPLPAKIENQSTEIPTPDFNECKTIEQVIENARNYLTSGVDALESAFFHIEKNGKLSPIGDCEYSESLATSADHLTEEGIIDWIAESGKPGVIPDLSDAQGSKRAFLIIAPLEFRGLVAGVIIAATKKQKADFSQKDLDFIASLAEKSSVALDNIRSGEEIERMNFRLTNLQNQMIRSSKMASVGEIASTFAKEIENPLKVISANLKLIEDGIGDKFRRIEIIKEQIAGITNMSEKIQKLLTPGGAESEKTYVRLKTIIDETILFVGSQLTRDNIGVETKYEVENIFVHGYKSQLEHVFISLLLNARNFMPDGGTISIGVFKDADNRAVVNVSDDGEGMSEEELQSLFEPFPKGEKTQSGSPGMFLTKSIVENHSGAIKAFSEIDKGATIKLIFPIAKEEN